jgi:hypothetical protein
MASWVFGLEFINQFGTYIRAIGCLFGCDQCWAILFFFQGIVEYSF